MASTPIVILLEQKQVDTLTELGINTAKLYYVDNDLLAPSAPALQAFSSGHYVIFTEGAEPEHRAFLSLLYGQPAASYTLTAKFRGLFVYDSPSAKFAIPKNLASITIS